MIRLYIRIVGGAINVLEQVLFWPSVGRFLKSTIVERDLDSEP
jgi:ABC-type antimicrobial peptide transport system permease subunit